MDDVSVAFSIDFVSKLDTDSTLRGKDWWHEVYDCEYEEEVLFQIIPRVLPADNPQVSETCSHIDLKGNFFCRCCMVDGTNEYKESNLGYSALFQVKHDTSFSVRVKMN